MAVVGTPVGGRVRFTYMFNHPSLSINGIDPLASSSQIFDLAQGISNIQDGIIRDVFLMSEFELKEDE